MNRRTPSKPISKHHRPLLPKISWPANYPGGICPICGITFQQDDPLVSVWDEDLVDPGDGVAHATCVEISYCQKENGSLYKGFRVVTAGRIPSY